MKGMINPSIDHESHADKPTFEICAILGRISEESVNSDLDLIDAVNRRGLAFTVIQTEERMIIPK
jgi:hypothetical protein